jgi:hypothetical protein
MIIEVMIRDHGMRRLVLGMRILQGRQQALTFSGSPISPDHLLPAKP